MSLSVLFLSSSCSFRQNILLNNMFSPPPQRLAPSVWEILDPPLARDFGSFGSLYVQVKIALVGTFCVYSFIYCTKQWWKGTLTWDNTLLFGQFFPPHGMEIKTIKPETSGEG